jgi:hypothetical protein
VASYQSADVLGECLATLAAQIRPPVETIVVDAGSTDGSVELARQAGARIVSTENRGLAWLYNRGAQAATGDYVLCSNSDIAFDERCLEHLAAELDGNERAFASDPTQLDWTGERVIHARTVLVRRFNSYVAFHGLDFRAPAAGNTRAVAAAGGVMMVRRSLLLDLGGFDESFFLDYEDIDLCWRAWLRGYESIYVPAARVRHKVGYSASPTVNPRRAAGARHNSLRFALKCLPLRYGLLTAARIVLGLPRHPSATWPGLKQVVRELPEIVRLRREIRPHPIAGWMARGFPGEPPAR